MNKAFLFFIFISAIIAIVFIKFPEIDLYVSGFFFDPEARFYLGGNPILETIHKSVRYLTITTAIILIGSLAACYIKKTNIMGVSKKKYAYLILALILGPGLIVNLVFKENWGRARPHHTEYFQGTKEFTPAFIMTDQCERNCSFASGDPSVGFYFLAFALAFQRRRKQFAIGSLALGSVYGATRIMQGAHFFSDVVFSFVFTFSACYLLYLIMRIKDEQ